MADPMTDATTVLIVAEVGDDGIRPATYELVTAGLQVGQGLGAQVVALLLGSGVGGSAEDLARTGVARVLVAADCGNGVSATLDFRRYLFINPDLSVHLHRHPVGEWVCLDAETAVEPTGCGLAVSTLSDEHGPIGRGLQSLFVAAR